ncbi:VOC family protein [Sphingomonas sp. BIUV-7]|uniref:VOC family protein n=1 Tax=Sphingomonas natans TaxID=3063330 RepID=A0ABT8Y8Z8_9SPHN|nr:VOC family protein [Sphingomonas sp. BIUV-7]MDO6414150.1 VOC family protein [Sphingomonas sp. BIUV-7]
MKLRSIELITPDAAKAAAFLTDIWGMAPAEQRGTTHYLRGSGTHPYLVALEEGQEGVRSTTFLCEETELASLQKRVAESGLAAKPVVSEDPGGGHGLIVELPEGVLFRFLAGSAEAEPLDGRDLPVKLTHVVLNAADAEAAGDVAERVLGFQVSDRTKAMVFVRCNDSHHSTAFARAGFSSLNHIAFEMADIDAVFRGIGRLRDQKMAPAWGPGRHGPGANVFAYFIAPFGAVVEFSTAVEKVADDYKVGAPEDWTWPENRIDHWGLSEKDNAALREAEQRFRFHRDWVAAPLATTAA